MLPDLLTRSRVYWLSVITIIFLRLYLNVSEIFTLTDYLFRTICPNSLPKLHLLSKCFAFCRTFFLKSIIGFCVVRTFPCRSSVEGERERQISNSQSGHLAPKIDLRTILNVCGDMMNSVVISQYLDFLLHCALANKMYSSYNCSNVGLKHFLTQKWAKIKKKVKKHRRS